MNYNYHAHTWRCGHATGTEEEYINYAVDHGVKYMGFSDHAPFVFPDGTQSTYRVQQEEAPGYISLLRELREKYKDQLDLKIGFEMEYYPAYFDAMLLNVRELGAEYLILGQHFIYNERPDGIASGRETDSVEHLREYVDCVVAGIKSGVFTYVAHPDLIRFTGDVAVYREEMRRLCAASREYNVPLEINFLGIREGRHYPRADLWPVVAEEQAPVTFGFDAHDTEFAYDGASLAVAKEMVKQYGLNYIGMPTVISIQK